MTSEILWADFEKLLVITKDRKPVVIREGGNAVGIYLIAKNKPESSFVSGSPLSSKHLTLLHEALWLKPGLRYGDLNNKLCYEIVADEAMWLGILKQLNIEIVYAKELVGK